MFAFQGGCGQLCSVFVIVFFSFRVLRIDVGSCFTDQSSEDLACGRQLEYHRQSEFVHSFFWRFLFSQRFRRLQPVPPILSLFFLPLLLLPQLLLPIVCNPPTYVLHPLSVAFACRFCLNISQLLLLRCSLTHPFPAMMAYCCWFCTVLHFVVKHSFFVCLPVLFVGYCWTRWRQLERQRESCTERTNAIKSSSSASRSLGLFCFGLFCLWFLAHMSLSLPHLSTFVCHILISPCASSTASCCS